jgi:type II secretory pathway component PulK
VRTKPRPSSSQTSPLDKLLQSLAAGEGRVAEWARRLLDGSESAESVANPGTKPHGRPNQAGHRQLAGGRS